MRPTTPKKISGSIRRFTATLGRVGNPIYLPYSPTSKNYLPGYCLSNCESELKRGQVDVVFGWILWEFRPASFIEAEFHAVISQHGKLKDITPRSDGENLILFLQDFNRVAVREDECTWKTWSNHKKSGALYEQTKQIYLQDFKSNIWA